MAPGLSFGAAASLVSLICGAIAMCVLYRLLLDRTDRFTTGLSVMALCVAPAAPIFQSAYTESLALLLLLAALWGLQRRRYGVFAVAGVLLSLTRAIAPPLAVVAAVIYLLRRRSAEVFPATERRRLAAGTLLVAASSFVWPLVVGIATGETSAYIKTQAAWATVAGNDANPWLVTMLHNSGQVFAVVIGVGLLTLICLRARTWPLALRLWPVPYVIFLLAVTPATASMLRFSMLTAGPWWPAPELSRRLTSPSMRGFLVTAVVVVGLLLQWWWLRTYFVIDPHSHGHP